MKAETHDLQTKVRREPLLEWSDGRPNSGRLQGSHGHGPSQRFLSRVLHCSVIAVDCGSEQPLAARFVSPAFDFYMQSKHCCSAGVFQASRCPPNLLCHPTCDHIPNDTPGREPGMCHAGMHANFDRRHIDRDMKRATPHRTLHDDRFHLRHAEACVPDPVVPASLGRRRSCWSDTFLSGATPVRDRTSGRVPRRRACSRRRGARCRGRRWNCPPCTSSAATPSTVSLRHLPVQKEHSPCCEPVRQSHDGAGTGAQHKAAGAARSAPFHGRSFDHRVAWASAARRGNVSRCLLALAQQAAIVHSFAGRTLGDVDSECPLCSSGCSNTLDIITDHKLHVG